VRRKLDRVLPSLLAAIELPDPLARLLDRQAELEAQKTEVVVVPHPAQLVASGRSLQEARDEVAAAEKNAAANDPAPLNEAIDSLDRRIKGWLTENADLLIETAIRDAVATTLEVAAKPAEILADFAPDFAANAILESGSASQLKAWQGSRELAQTFEDVRRGWFRVYRMAVARPRPDRPRSEFTPSRPGGVHTWVDPELIADVNVRDGVAVDVCAIAPHRDNYRLASPGEILKLSRKHRLVGPIRGRRVFEIEQPATDGRLQ